MGRFLNTCTMSSADTTPRLFVEQNLSEGPVLLNAAQSHYLVRVMRRKAGDRLRLFNGRDGEWTAEVVDPDKKSCRLRLMKCTRQQTRVPDIMICFAPIKKAPMDYLVEKATELGARRLQPILTGRTQNRRVNTARLGDVAREAAEQCECLDVPAIAPLMELSALLVGWPEGRSLFFLDETREGEPLARQAARHPDGPIALISGPEGGFTPDERRMLIRHTASIPCSLGPRLLRAETAAVAALAIWQSVAGDI